MMEDYGGYAPKEPEKDYQSYNMAIWYMFDLNRLIYQKEKYMIDGDYLRALSCLTQIYTRIIFTFSKQTDQKLETQIAKDLQKASNILRDDDQENDFIAINIINEVSRFLILVMFHNELIFPRSMQIKSLEEIAARAGVKLEPNNTRPK